MYEVARRTVASGEQIAAENVELSAYEMIIIDGLAGEGGGQVLRTALGLSLITGRPFAIHNIRGNRKKPGLLQQHLTAVRAAREIGRAEVAGAGLHSSALTFEPSALQPGSYQFAVGTAGSATLVLQTILPALWMAATPTQVRLEGGTHNPWAPPFPFLVQAFLPLLSRMGVQVRANLIRPGFYPAGGGAFEVEVEPATRLTPLDLRERGNVERISATATVAKLDRKIAERELHVIAEMLDLPPEDLTVEEIRDAAGPGNVVTIAVQSEHITEVFTGFGQRGVRAEAVAQAAAEAARSYLQTDIPVGEHLADQLLIPLAIAGAGVFRTGRLSSHAETNMEVIARFLEVDFAIDKLNSEETLVRVGV